MEEEEEERDWEAVGEVWGWEERGWEEREEGEGEKGEVRGRLPQRRDQVVRGKEGRGMEAEEGKGG